MEVQGYVYILKHPITDMVHYVGYSKDPISRSKAYSGTRDGRRKTPAQCWCSRVLEETGLPPVFDVVDAIPTSYTRRQCMMREKLWIVAYIDKGHPILNLHI